MCAVKIDWKIISNRALKLINKPSKAKANKSLIWRSVYWIEKVNFDLYVWEVIWENWDLLKIKCYNRNKFKNPNRDKIIIERDINSITLE